MIVFRQTSINLTNSQPLQQLYFALSPTLLTWWSQLSVAFFIIHMALHMGMDQTMPSLFEGHWHWCYGKNAHFRVGQRDLDRPTNIETLTMKALSHSLSWEILWLELMTSYLFTKSYIGVSFMTRPWLWGGNKFSLWISTQDKSNISSILSP